MKSRMTIGKQLFASVGTEMVVALAISCISLLGIGKLGSTIDKLTRVNAKKVYLSGEINTVTSDMVGEERGIVLRFLMKDAATAEKYNRDFSESAARLKKRLDDFIPLIETAEAQRMIDHLETAYGTILEGHQELYRLASSGNLTAAEQTLADRVMPLLIKVSDEGDRLAQQQEGLIRAVGDGAMATVERTRWAAISMMIVAILVGCAVAFLVRHINRTLRQSITELSGSAEQVASAASQVSSSSQSLAQGASEQAASLEETSASSEEINSMANKNSENSQTATQLVEQSQEKFIRTNAALERMVTAMDEINTSSDKISKIIKVIDEIAFQTNILALNAAVEAARAGEAGMGFAVVADEVRNLAQRCAQAAKDTAALIEESIVRSNDGKTKVDQVAGSIREITEESAKVKTLVEEVNLGSHQQSDGIQQVAKAITQMEQVTQKNAANAEESASAAEELNAQSEMLKEVVGRLTTMVGGSAESRERNSRGAQPKPRSGVLAARQPGESGSNLQSLRKAASRPDKATKPAEVPVLSVRSSRKEAFPLDDDFKEF